jgi:hypothetical protein
MKQAGFFDAGHGMRGHRRRLLCASIAATLSCGGGGEGLLSGQLEQQLAVARNRPGVADLSAIDAGAWTRLYIFGPYSGARVRDSVLGFPLTPAEAEGIEMRDDANLFVFVEEQRVVGHATVSRRYGDFCSAERRVAHSRSEARFSISSGDANGRHVCLARVAAPIR